MDELIDKIPGDIVAALVVGIVIGVMISWRFTRAMERFRESVAMARINFRAAIGFARYARENFGAMLTGGALFAVATFGIGALVYLRVA